MDAHGCYLKYYKDFQAGKRENIKSSHNMAWKNIPSLQRNALRRLANDDSIVLKMASKGGAIIIMNKEHFILSCEEVLGEKGFMKN